MPIYHSKYFNDSINSDYIFDSFYNAFGTINYEDEKYAKIVFTPRAMRHFQLRFLMIIERCEDTKMENLFYGLTYSTELTQKVLQYGIDNFTDEEKQYIKYKYIADLYNVIVYSFNSYISQNILLSEENNIVIYKVEKSAVEYFYLSNSF